MYYIWQPTISFIYFKVLFLVNSEFLGIGCQALLQWVSDHPVEEEAKDRRSGNSEFLLWDIQKWRQ